MRQGPLPKPLMHPSTPQQGYTHTPMDNRTSAFNSDQDSKLCLHPSAAKTNTIHALLHSSVRMKDIRIPHRSSSSLTEPLAPIAYAFKRWRHPRHSLSATLLCRPHCKNDGPLSPASFILDQIVERPPSTAGVAGVSELGIRRTLSSAKCASTEKRQSDVTDSISSTQHRVVDLRCGKVPAAVTGDDVDVDKEAKRKLIMWRAACAMAHAYLHRHDQHQDDLHQHNGNELSFHIPGSHHLICNVACNDGNMQVNAPLLQEESYELRQVKQHVNDPVSSFASPPSTSSKDGVFTSTMCLLSDVVCIDEVVNPTQAAEWFGALFASTSTLVS